MSDLPHVEGTLHFLGEVAGTPTHYLGVAPPEGAPERYPQVAHRVRIRDARPIAGRLSVERQGFVLATDPEGASADVSDERAVAARYYPALERLLRQVTGARRVIVFDHTLRSSAVSERTAAGVDTAVTEAHNDYTAASGPARVREMLLRLAPEDDPEALMRRRYAVFNVWRPTNGVVEQMPLALCDMRTLRPADFVDVVLRWPHRTGYVSAVRFSPAQRWYYFPGLASDEALVFKCFDSLARDGVRSSAHAAFRDPTSPAGAKVRESIEARAIALFDGP